MRIGIGFDVHKFDKGRPLILGGVAISGSAGLSGHSDADVLIHSIMDAVLGAAGMGDIGQLFPDTDIKYKDIKSSELLDAVHNKIKDAWAVENVDSVLVCESPKIAPHKDKMRDNISKILNIAKDKVNIKATTAEGLGAIGRSEGICAQAVVLLRKVRSL